MPSIIIKETEHFDIGLRKFKRACEKAAIVPEIRAREYSLALISGTIAAFSQARLNFLRPMSKCSVSFIIIEGIMCRVV